MTNNKLLKSVAFYALVVVIVLFSIFPFYYAIISSFRSGNELFSVAYLPERLDFSNYAAVFERQPFGQNILNSIIVAGSVVTVADVRSSFTAAKANHS